jgi:hypothetical protein
MRRILSLLVASLIGLPQPALAVCVIRGGATHCIPNSKFPDYFPKSDEDQPVEDPSKPRATSVMQASTSSHNAWLLLPENTGGATVVRPGVAVAACAAGTSC